MVVESFITWCSTNLSDNLLKAPDVNELVPVKVQPSEQIIISAQISSSSSSVFISWTHNNVTYDRHHKENPICDDDRNKVRYIPIQGCDIVSNNNRYAGVTLLRIV